MRRLSTGFALLLLLPATAGAKTGLILTPLPYGLHAGETWEMKIEYIRADVPADPPVGSHPFVRITSDDLATTADFPVRQARGDGAWARVVFPRPGLWRYTVHGFGRQTDQQTWDPVMIVPRPKPHLKPATTQASSFPVGWLGAGAAIALVVGAILIKRLRSH